MRSEAVQQILDDLAAQQERVALRVGRLTDAGWAAALQPLGLERLVQLGHFPSHPWELDWSPREVAGHLRDSARVALRRIARIRSEERPQLQAFRTDDPERLADYRRVPPAELLEQLEEARARLHAAIADLEGAELDRTGVLPGRGEVTLRRLLTELPVHHRDHAEQLAALTAESLA